MRFRLSLTAVVLASLLCGRAAMAQQVDFSLNLLFNDPADNQSGGDWELVARTSDSGGVASQGILGANVLLSGIGDPVFETPFGTVQGEGVGFEFDGTFDEGDYLQVTFSQIPNDINLGQTLLYQVGLIGGATEPGEMGTPNFAFDENSERNIPWGIDDTLGQEAWNGAALFATGSFETGIVPDFVINGDDRTESVVFTSLGDAVTPGASAAAAVSTFVRSNLLDQMGLPGDYNNSGQVEQGDLDLVLLNWGEDGSTPPMNWVNDLPTGQIDQNELDGVLLNWGNSAQVALSGAQVPEPTSLALCGALALAAFAFRRVL